MTEQFSTLMEKWNLLQDTKSFTALHEYWQLPEYKKPHSMIWEHFKSYLYNFTFLFIDIPGLYVYRYLQYL